MNPYLEALGFLGLLCGLSVVCDRLLSKEGRKEFGNKLRMKIEARELSAGERWGPVAIVDALPPFSLRSLFASILLSFISLLVILYIQYFLLDFGFSDLRMGVFSTKDGRLYFSVLAMVFVGNIIADYLSFTQSLIILGMIRRGTSKASAIFIFITDLLASINIFTFVYAFFLAFALYNLANYETRASFVVSLEEDKPDEQIVEYFRKNSTIDKLDTQYTASLYHLGYGSRYANATVRIVGPSGVSIEQLGNAILAFMIKLYPESGPELSLHSGSVALHGTSVFDEHQVQLRGSVAFWLNAKSGFLPWYSSAYLQSDEVQDNFFEVATLSPGLKTLNYVRDLANSQAVASAKADFIFGWCVNEQRIVEINDGDCKPNMSILSSDISAFREDISLHASFGGQMPLYSFFFTSLFLTIAIYCMYLSMYMMKGLNSVSTKLSMPMLSYLNFEEHPITVISFPFNLFASAIYLFFAVH